MAKVPHSYDPKKISVNDRERDAVFRVVKAMPRVPQPYADFIEAVGKKLQKLGHTLSRDQIGYALENLENNNRLQRSAYVLYNGSAKHLAGV